MYPCIVDSNRLLMTTFYAIAYVERENCGITVTKSIYIYIYIYIYREREREGGRNRKSKEFQKR